jgi:hypothetical protein
MARFKRTAPPRPPAGPPASTKDGAAAVIAASVKLFDRKDGEGVDKRLLAEILFHAAFSVLDGVPEDEKQRLASRVHAGAYDRMAGNPIIDSAPSKTGSPDAVSPPSNTAGFKSSGPGPEKAP